MARYSMTAVKRQVLASLIQIRDSGPVRPQSGICYNVMLITSSDIGPCTPIQVSMGLAIKWPKGVEKLWPVAGEDEEVGRDDYNAWDINTEAGARRHELLAWMIQQLEQELSDERMA